MLGFVVGGHILYIQVIQCRNKLLDYCRQSETTEELAKTSLQDSSLLLNLFWLKMACKTNNNETSWWLLNHRPVKSPCLLLHLAWGLCGEIEASKD